MSRERRLKSGNKVIFDYKELLDKKGKSNKTLLKMEKGPQSYTSAKGTQFWSEHPYQWVAKSEAEFLTGLKVRHLNFREATIEDVEDYYALD